MEAALERQRGMQAGMLDIVPARRNHPGGVRANTLQKGIVPSRVLDQQCGYSLLEESSANGIYRPGPEIAHGEILRHLLHARRNLVDILVGVVS